MAQDNWWAGDPDARAPAQPSQQPIRIGAPDPKIPLQVETMRQQLEIERERIRLAQEAAARANQKDAIDQRTTNERGGLDTTESERTAGYLATRVAGGLEDLAKIGKVGAPSLKDATIGGTLLGNYATDEGRQRTINAQRDILDAALTLGTGAAYTQEQIDSYRMSYFPQPGDKPGTIEDKTVRLKRLVDAARLKAGAASGLIDKALEANNTFGTRDPNAENPERPGYTNSGALMVNYNNGPTNPADDPGIAKQAAQEAGLPYNDTPLSQTLSAVNRGVASTLGAPVDLANTALGLGAQGVNALAGTNLQTADNPFLGGQWLRDRLQDAGSIGPESDRAGSWMPFTRRVAESVGSAAIPVAGSAGSLSKALIGLGTAAGGGVGAATARETFPGNPLAEMGGELLGSGLTAGSLLGSLRRSAQRGIESQVPTIPQLRQQASDLYNAAESRGVVAGPNVTSNLAGRVNSIANNEKLIWPTGEVNPAYPRASASMKMLDAHAGQSIDPRQIQVLRDNLTDAVGATEGKERRIARQMLNAFDDETVPLAPELSNARKVASRYINAEKIGQARDLADASSSTFSGSGSENALRTQFRNLDKRITSGKEAGFNPATIEAIRRVTRGTPASNAARQVGKLAPTGVVSFGLGAGVPAAIGNMLGGPVGAAVGGVGAPVLGLFGRKVAEKMATRGADLADLTARYGGALPTPQVLTPELQRLMALGLLGQSGQYLNK